MKKLSGKHLIRALGRTSVFDLGVRCLGLLPRRCRNHVRVLTYHRVDEVDSRPDLDPSLISATPDQFERQVGWLAKDFDLVSLSDVIDGIHERITLPKRAVLLTFDDAYCDFGEKAWPILRQYNAPTTLFVPTGFPDSGRAFWWDCLYFAITNCRSRDRIETPVGIYPVTSEADRNQTIHAIKQQLKMLPHEKLMASVESICDQCDAKGISSEKIPPAVMTWKDLIRVWQEGVTLAPHTRSHVLLNTDNLSVTRDEILESHELLRQKIDTVPDAIAYPSGHYQPEVVQFLENEKFDMAFTTIRGVNDLQNCSPLMMRRINVGRHTPDSLIRAQLLAPQSWINQPLPDAFPCVSRQTHSSETEQCPNHDRASHIRVDDSTRSSCPSKLTSSAARAARPNS